ASRRTSLGSNGSVARTSTTSGRPRVNVPVLSRATVRTWARRSRIDADLQMMPDRAARDVPAMNATGAAMMSGQGVATTSTSANRTGSPVRAQAVAPIVYASTLNGSATLSASRTNGAFEVRACATSAMIAWYSDPAAVVVARTSAGTVVSIDPDITASPRRRSTGSGSPVREASSNAASSVSRTPSTGTTSPGLTQNRSPARISSTGTSTTLPSGRARWA